MRWHHGAAPALEVSTRCALRIGWAAVDMDLSDDHAGAYNTASGEQGDLSKLPRIESWAIYGGFRRTVYIGKGWRVRCDTDSPLSTVQSELSSRFMRIL